MKDNELIALCVCIGILILGMAGLSSMSLEHEYKIEQLKYECVPKHESNDTM